MFQTIIFGIYILVSWVCIHFNYTIVQYVTPNIEVTSKSSRIAKNPNPGILKKQTYHCDNNGIFVLRVLNVFLEKFLDISLSDWKVSLMSSLLTPGLFISCDLLLGKMQHGINLHSQIV